MARPSRLRQRIVVRLWCGRLGVENALGVTLLHIHPRGNAAFAYPLWRACRFGTGIAVAHTCMLPVAHVGIGFVAYVCPLPLRQPSYQALTARDEFVAFLVLALGGGEHPVARQILGIDTQSILAHGALLRLTVVAAQCRIGLGQLCSERIGVPDGTQRRTDIEADVALSACVCAEVAYHIAMLFLLSRTVWYRIDHLYTHDIERRRRLVRRRIGRPLKTADVYHYGRIGKVALALPEHS